MAMRLFGEGYASNGAHFVKKNDSLVGVFYGFI